ncbi:hypothetical protein ACFUTR_28670 [Streptomyces sp. NPDC057367]|uniref:hypothetical protein n=1 Tax=Streptomyces sp. NPDC057367 TaxID=3346108 RepID=UPI00364365B1
MGSDDGPVGAQRPLRVQASAGSPDVQLATTPEERQAAAVHSLVEPGERRRLPVREPAEPEAGPRPAVLAAVSAGVPYRRLEIDLYTTFGDASAAIFPAPPLRDEAQGPDRLGM